MNTNTMAQIIEGFVDRYYPKGDKNRGFAIAVLSAFLLELGSEKSKYKLIKNGRRKK